jgi:heptosyltransferase-3
VKRILIYRAGRIGDSIVAIPAIQALRRAYPNASLALVTVHGAGGLWADDVFGEFGWFDDIVTYRPDVLRHPRAVLELLSALRRLEADVVVHLGSEQNSWLRVQRDRAFFALAGITRFVGGSSAAVTWYGRLNRTDTEHPYEVDRLLDLVHAAGTAPSAPVAFDLPIGDAVRTQIDALLATPGFEAGRPLVALCPGSVQPVKRWPIERYGEVGAQLIQRYGVSLVVVGGPQEAAAAAQLGAGWPPGRWLNAAAGRLTTLAMAELLRRCIIYVGNDMGPMHVAAAVGTRCVAVFGAQYPARSWHPYGEGHVVLRHQPPCRNCFLTECIQYQSRCVTDTSVNDVQLACDRVLAAAN